MKLYNNNIVSDPWLQNRELAIRAVLARIGLEHAGDMPGIKISFAENRKKIYVPTRIELCREAQNKENKWFAEWFFTIGLGRSPDKPFKYHMLATVWHLDPMVCEVVLNEYGLLIPVNRVARHAVISKYGVIPMFGFDHLRYKKDGKEIVAEFEEMRKNRRKLLNRLHEGIG